MFVLRELSFESFISSLYEQHMKDLYIYRISHTIYMNRLIHWIMIPIETLSLFIIIYSSFMGLLFLLLPTTLNQNDDASLTSSLSSLNQQKVVSLSKFQIKQQQRQHTPPTLYSYYLKLILFSIEFIIAITSLIISFDMIGLLSFFFHISIMPFIILLERKIYETLIQDSQQMQQQQQQEKTNQLQPLLFTKTIESNRNYNKKKNNNTKRSDIENSIITKWIQYFFCDNLHSSKQHESIATTIETITKQKMTTLCYLFFIGIILWIISWFIQIYVGHYIIELNQPSFIHDYNSISYLSITQSVLIAWKS